MPARQPGAAVDRDGMSAGQGLRFEIFEPTNCTLAQITRACAPKTWRSSIIRYSQTCAPSASDQSCGQVTRQPLAETLSILPRKPSAPWAINTGQS